VWFSFTFAHVFESFASQVVNNWTLHPRPHINHRCCFKSFTSRAGI